MVIKGLGIQLSIAYKNGAVRNLLIPTEQIDAILILEGVRRMQFVYYGAIKRRDQRALTVLFPSTLPTFEHLLAVHRESNASLMDNSVQ